MTRHYPDLGSVSDWSCCMENLLQPIRSTTQIWVVTRHLCARFSDADVITRGNQLWRRKMSSVYSRHSRQDLWLGFACAPPPPTLAIHPSSKLNGEMSKSYGILYCWKYVFLYHSLHEQDWIIVWSHLFATQSFYSKRTSFPVSRFLRSVRALTPLGRETLETRFVGLIDEPLVHYNALKTKFTDVTISAGIFTYYSRLWKWAAFESQWSSSKERMLLNRL